MGRIIKEVLGLRNLQLRLTLFLVGEIVSSGTSTTPSMNEMQLPNMEKWDIEGCRGILSLIALERSACVS